MRSTTPLEHEVRDSPLDEVHSPRTQSVRLPLECEARPPISERSRKPLTHSPTWKHKPHHGHRSRL